MKNTKKKDYDIDMPEMFGRGVTYVYLLVMLGVFPVYYPGHLIEIHSEKAGFFTVAGVVYLCLAAIPLACGFFRSFKDHRKIKFDICDIFAAVFLISVIVSTLAAYNTQSAVYGNSRIKTGAIVMFLCVISYYIVKRFAKFNMDFIWVSIAAGEFIYLSGIFLTCKTDLLNMQRDIVEAQKEIFVSPLGNINYNVAYIGLMLPVAMSMFLMCRDRVKQIALAVYMYLGLLDSICLRTESALAMLVFIFALLLYFALENELCLKRYACIVQLLCAANITAFLLKMLLGDHMYDFDGIHRYLFAPWLIALEAVLCIALYVFSQKASFKQETLARLQKLYGFAFLGLIAVIVLLILVLNVLFEGGEWGGILGLFVMDDATGNSRGYIWKRTLQLFWKMPFINKIFGCGLGCFFDFIYPVYGEDMMNRFGAIFYDPHNDFLQTLTTTGIAGAVGFFGLIISVIVLAMKKRKQQEMQTALVMALAAYLLQGLVNTYTIFTIPLVFILLGMKDSVSKTDT